MAASFPSKVQSLKDLDKQTFDFIIVGGGTSGCLIAARLATAMPQRRILIVEAGGEVDEKDLVPGYCKPRFGSSDGNWMYETLPQKELGGRKLPYPRGPGGNNFMAWVRGPSVDYDGWAEAVGDEWWKWDNVLPYMKKLEDFRPSIPNGKSKYADPTPGFHSAGGMFAVGYGTEWQPLIEYCMQASQEAGHSVNLDNNDGSPIGLSIAQFNVDNGARVTSASAFLNSDARSKLKNLIVVTQTIASKIIFDGKRATGVQLLPTVGTGTDDIANVYASEEVILTAGCFQSPQLLLLSGVGPADHLKGFGIPMILDAPAVGQNIQDHSAFACEFIIKHSIPGHNQLLNDPKALDAAVKQYATDKTGPLAMFGASAAIIFPKLPKVLSSTEFAFLSPAEQDYMRAGLRPSTEIWMHSGPLFYTGPCPPDVSVLVLEGLCQNNLSRGSLQLKSTNPRELPAIDPGYLTHPYDVRIAVETLREIVKIAQTPTFSSIIESLLLAPRAKDGTNALPSISGDDDEILENFIRDTLTQGFHSMSTCMMGQKEEKNKVVGTDFKIDGLQGLRVADMSVCPILTSNHTQINAYLIGERCAEFVLKEHGAGSLKGQHAHL
ncbi:related to alcohol oxidase [Phialocephala subalpina]|uniref:Related to alcohol oxidase n=1 Tax=Phialocephala subalpina TaxID=576137 RepID=A0A1L7WJA1_9HELO|nr:related to alcohol oxidase [Phialocephala subalpina]